MKELGYLVAAYVLTAAAIGAYLLSLARRQRALERRVGKTPRQAPEPVEGRSASRAGEGTSRG